MKDRSHRDPNVQRAAEAVGGLPALAAKLGITRQAIYQWDELPMSRLKQIAEVSGLPAHELRPDLFPAPSET
jgi:DNA-binding transcriptional regulator YdaS (Cro superfamily)